MLDILMWFGIGIIPVFLLLDTVQSTRKYKTPKFWKLRGIVITGFVVYLSMAIAGMWEGIFANYSMFDNSELSVPLGALLGIFVYEFGHYWYHRAVHASDFLFNLTHQIHHSAEGIDSYSAYYLHPMDVLAFTTISSLAFFPILGLSLEAGLYAAAFVGFNVMFQHVNIKTPHWIGYFIQRPESHCIHHERGLHAYNYADLPLIDMIFGTFRNPKADEAYPKAGYYDGASLRMAEMLLFQDVTEPKQDKVDKNSNQLREVA